MIKPTHLLLVALLCLNFGCKPKSADDTQPSPPSTNNAVTPPQPAPPTNASTSPAVTERRKLSNGLTAGVVYYANSTNLFIFSLLPHGLTSDGPGKTQWAHLIEHLVIRSTPGAAPGSANAEVAPDHLRLDYYGHVDSYKTGFGLHRKWLEGAPFPAESLPLDKTNILAECDYVAERLATHKFATAAWNQARHHGINPVPVRGDVLKASLSEIQAYRDAQLPRFNEATIVVVGGLEPKTAFANLEQEFGQLKTTAGPSLKPTKIATGDLNVTWDMDARHLLLAWPIPGPTDAPNHAPLMVAAQWLVEELYSDPTFKAATGTPIGGTDLKTSTSQFCYLSVTLTPEADVKALKELVTSRIKQLHTTPIPDAKVSSIATQTARLLGDFLDIMTFRKQINPAITTTHLEGNLGLQWATRLHRYGDLQPALVSSLTNLTAKAVQDAATKYLSADKAEFCLLQPKP